MASTHPRRGAARVRGHIAALDGLRGAAACVVVAAHSVECAVVGSVSMQSAMPAWLIVFFNSKVAVEIFFVLSGFVLAGSLARWPGWAGLIQFLVRRVFRIHPPYVAAVLFAWCASFGYAPLREGVGAIADRLVQVHIAPQELLRSLSFPGNAFLQLPVGWTLEVEMVFSFLLPTMLLLARRVHWSALVALCFVPLAIGDNGQPVLKFGIDFAFGVALFLERRRLTAWTGGIRGVGAALWFAASLTLANIPRLLGWPFVFEGGSPESIAVQSLGAVGLVAGAAFVPGIARVFSLRPLLFAGRVSYSLYLIHFPIVLVFASLHLGESDLWLPPAVFGVSLWISAMFYRWIERPSITLGNRVSTSLVGWLGVSSGGSPKSDAYVRRAD